MFKHLTPLAEGESKEFYENYVDIVDLMADLENVEK